MSYAFDMDSILMKLDQRRTAAKRDQDKRREEVYERIPKIKEIDDEMREGTLLAIRKNLRDSSDDEMRPAENIAALAKLQKKNEELTEKKKRLLLENGYDEDYLERKFFCPICKDEGYVDGGKCRCLKQLITEERYRQSNLSKRLSEENFETFDISYYSMEKYPREDVSPYDNIKNILERAKAYVREFDRDRGNMIIFGESGRGKTFLTNCIAKEILESGHSVFYLSAGELVDDIINSYLFRKDDGEDDMDKRERYDFVYEAELLIIDDLGTEPLNRQSVTQMFRVINTRISNGKATIISSNLDIKDIRDTYTERFASRIAENYDFYNIFGSNIRMVKKKRMLQKAQ